MDFNTAGETGARSDVERIDYHASASSGEGGVMLSYAQIKAMFETKIEADKRGGSAGPVAQAEYQRAAMLEMSEMLAHVDAETDVHAVTPYAHSSEGLLLMLHYILGDLLYDHRESPGEAVAMFEAAMRDDTGYVDFDSSRYLLDTLSTPRAVQLQLGRLTVGRYSIPLFHRILAGFGLTWNDMHLLFISKTLLALFRLDHGYQSGRYVTMWNGRKDGEHLIELMASIDSSSDDYFKQVYGAIKRRYVASLSGAEGI